MSTEPAVLPTRAPAADEAALTGLLQDVYTRLDALMIWDNNVLDEASACQEYKKCVRDALELLPRLATTLSARYAEKETG